MNHIVLVNVSGDMGEVIPDVLGLWGFQSVKVRLDDPSLDHRLDASLVIMQFLEYSDQEMEACRRIVGHNPQLNVLATAPFISLKNIFVLARSGVREFLTQPFTPPDLKAAVERHAQRPALTPQCG